jgi:hypothetical protein
VPWLWCKAPSSQPPAMGFGADEHGEKIHVLHIAVKIA